MDRTRWPAAVHEVTDILRDPAWTDAAGASLVRWDPALERPVRAERASALRIGLIDLAVSPDLPMLLTGALALRSFSGFCGASRDALGDHGTAMASLLVGPGGWLPGAPLWAAAIGDASGRARNDAMAEALRWLDAVGARIIVVPMGSETDVAVVNDVLDALLARADPPHVLASLGNTHPEPGLFPARHPGVVAVAAADHGGRLLASAARSPAPDRIAPGENITVQVGLRRHASMSGSSVACAIAAGILARRIAAE